jgi:hypothetical protein
MTSTGWRSLLNQHLLFLRRRGFVCQSRIGLNRFAVVPAGTVVVSSCIPPSLPSPSPPNTLRFQRCCVGVGMGLFELVLPNVLRIILFSR